MKNYLNLNSIIYMMSGISIYPQRVMVNLLYIILSLYISPMNRISSLHISLVDCAC